MLNENLKMSKDVKWEGLEIYKTHDYDKFKLIKGNRKVRTFQVNRLKASYEKGNIPVPLIVNKSFEIIDGQHRREAIRQLNLPLPYMIINDANIKEVQILNMRQKNWTMEDHLKCYVERGLKMYIRYNEEINERFYFDHKFKITMVKGKYSQRGHSEDALEQKTEVEKFQDGEFEATDQEFKHATEVGLKIEDVDRYFKDYLQRGRRSPLWNAVRKLADYPDYNHSEMVKKLETQRFKIEKKLIKFRELSTNEFLIILEDIYNYGRHGQPLKFRYDLKTEAGKKDRVSKENREISA